jgi:hypothetical protein
MLIGQWHLSHAALSPWRSVYTSRTVPGQVGTGQIMASPPGLLFRAASRAPILPAHLKGLN